jgi:hypothetical protein
MHIQWNKNFGTESLQEIIASYIIRDNLRLRIIIPCLILLAFTLNNAFPFASSITSSSNPIRVPEDFQTIQEAINNASSGDTIIVANGTYNEHLTINKSIILIGAGNNQTILNDAIADTAVTITADNVTIKGFTTQNFYAGIIINQSQNIYIADNQITRIWTSGAVCILDSTNITLTRNTITNNDSPGAKILNSNVTRFSRNTITHNVGIGISATNCINLTANDNQIESNGGDAIYCSNVYNFYATGNTFALNGFRGIWATYSNGNAFHNNFVRNWENTRSISSNITWDDGYPSGGNYWSNYTGSDIFSDVNQTQTGSDGIGDVPFILPQESEQDRYPLMGNFTTFTVTIEAQNYTADFVSNALIKNLYTNQTAKSLYLTIDNSNPAGFCRVVIPMGLMWCDNLGQWSVMVDGNPIDRAVMEDGNHTNIYFTFTQGIFLVKITATYMVPENGIFMPLFLLASALSVIIYLNRKLRRTKPRN